MSHGDDHPSSRIGWAGIIMCRPRQAFAALAAPFLLFVAVTQTQSAPSSRFLLSQSNPPPLPKRAVVNFVDESPEYLWGVYSTHTRLRKLGMTPTVAHIAMVSSDIAKKSKDLLIEWLGPQQVVEFDRHVIMDKVDKSLRQGVFIKTLAYNLTDFEKIIVIDNDVMIRRNIMHWFDYPAPAMTGARGMIEWNSGAMVLEPSKEMFDLLLEYLPKVKRWTTAARRDGKWDPNEDEEDTWTSNGGHQGFLSAFYMSNVTNGSIYTMSYGHSALTSDLEDRQHNQYYWRYRPHVFETVHFTRHKPWKPQIFSSNPVVCGMMREWAASVKGAPRDRLPKINDFMRKCPPPQDFELERLKAEVS